jgi:hypothetical protein
MLSDGLQIPSCSTGADIKSLAEALAPAKSDDDKKG